MYTRQYIEMYNEGNVAVNVSLALAVIVLIHETFSLHFFILLTFSLFKKS